MISSMLGKRARASSTMTFMSPFSMGRLNSRSRTFRLRRWALSVWNSSVQHNTQASDTLQVGPLHVEQLCTTQHTGFRHTSGGPSLCGTALYNTTHASDTVDTLQVAPLCVEQLCTTQHTLQTQSTHFRWPLSVWNSSVQHNTRFRHSRHTSGGPSLCGTALYNTTHASDTVDTLQVAPLCVEQLCTTQHTLQTQSTHFRWPLSVWNSSVQHNNTLQTQLTHFKDDHHMTAV